MSKAANTGSQADKALAKLVSEELNITPAQTLKLIERLGRLEKALVTIRPLMRKMSNEMEVRRRMAKIAPDVYGEPGFFSKIGSAVKAAAVGVVKAPVSIAKGFADIFKGNPYERPMSEWSVPMLEAELKRLEAEKAGA